MKKILSFFLVCVLLVCLIPVQAFAASNTYELEPNDSKENATELSNGVTLSGATGTSYSGSHDYLKFTLDTSANVTIKITVDGSDRRVTLDDPYETLEYYYSFYNYGGGKYQRTVTKLLAAGTYYLVLIKGISSYTVNVSWTPRESYCTHSGQWKTEKPATCTTDGAATRVCTSCSMKEYKVLEATGHSFGADTVLIAATCLKDGQTAQICGKCNTKENYKTIPALGHSWNYGELAAKPSENAEGRLDYVCRACEETKSEYIPALSKQPNNFGITWPDTPTFDGTPKEPKPVVSYQGKELVEGQDYTVAYSNNVLASNCAVAQITGLGAYEAYEDTVTFAIQPADIAALKDTFYAGTAFYSGRQVEPETVRITDGNGNLLEKGKDFVTTLQNNVLVGNGTVRVIGMGNYTGSFDATFEIAEGTAPSSEDLSLLVNTDLNLGSYVLEEGTKLSVKPESKTYAGTLSVYKQMGSEETLYDYDSLDTYTSVIYTPDPGEYAFRYTYTVTVRECGYEYRNGVMVQVCYNRTEYKYINWLVRVVDSDPDTLDTLEAGAPVFQDSDTVYLSAECKNDGLIQDVVWNTTDASVATVSDGIVTLLKPGSGSITATVGDQTVSWLLDDISAVSLSKNTTIAHYDPASGAPLVIWKNEVLDQGTDYSVSTETAEGVTTVTVTGMNNFCDSTSRMFYEDTAYPYICTTHKWTEVGCETDAVCKICGAEGERAAGHKIVTDAAVAATCTTDGKTEGKHCSVCGTVTKAQETVKATGHSFANGKCDICGTADPNYAVPSKSGVTRVFGADRYATSFKAADTLKSELGVSKFQNIIVASGTGFADALAGSYLAAVKEAPILLVKGSNVNAVKDYIKQNLTSGGTVYLLGGVNAVPKTMESGLDGFKVKRLGGADRYETNLLILKEAGVGNKDIIVCTGLNFADSLSASASGLPILLVKGGLTDTQKAFLKGTSGKKIIVGGTSAVSGTVESQLKTYGSVKRLAGDTRYDTSVLVAKEFFSAPKAAVLAYAQNFPDGLSGGPLAYTLKAPLILTDNKKPTAAVNYATGLGIKSGYVLGGTGLISDKVAKNIFSMAASDAILVK